MSELFARVPLWLSLDGGVRALPAEARLALYELAVNGGVARCGEDAAPVLDALAAGAGAHLDRLLDLGVVGVEDGRLVLLAPDGSPSTVGAAPRNAGVPSVPAPALRRTDDRAVAKRLGALWSKAGIDTTAARVAWLDSAAGERFLEREGRDRSWVLDLAGRTHGVNRGRFGRRQPGAGTVSTLPVVDAANGVNHGVNPPLPSAPPLSEKNEERSTEGARARGVNPDTANGVNPDTASVNPTASTSAAPLRLPTVERPAGVVGAGDVLAELRGAGLRLSITGAIEVELDRALAGVTPPWSLPGVRRLAAHVRAGHLKDGWKPALSHLRGRDGSWSTLLSLYDEAQGCERCARATRPAATPPVDALKFEDPTTPEARDRQRAQAASMKAALAAAKAREATHAE
jgi:hypothetical protein